MKEALSRIVRFGYIKKDCIDKMLLDRYTCHYSRIQHPADFSPLGVRHLHLLGTRAAAKANVKEGTYLDPSNQWVLVVASDTDILRHWLSACGDALERLTIQYTSMDAPDLRKLKGLKALMLHENQSLTTLPGLGNLSRLEELTIQNTQMKRITFSEALKNLRSLHLNSNPQLGELRGLQYLLGLESLLIRFSSIGKISLRGKLPRLTNFRVDRLPLESADFLTELPGLQNLELRNTKITLIPSLAHCRELRTLDLTASPVSSLDHVTFPESVNTLLLGNCGISHLPESIRSLPRLCYLDLSGLNLDRLPCWLPDLHLSIGASYSYGINLEMTRVKGLDISFFTQSQEVIQDWFLKLRSVHPTHRSHRTEPPTIATEYKCDPHNLEMRVVYDHPADGVLHRLMDALPRDLVTSQCWCSGALFRQRTNCLSALVETEGNVLRIFIRSERDEHWGQTYLNTILDTLSDIHSSMSLKRPESYIVHKHEGRTEEFHYETLLSSLKEGNVTIYSRLMGKSIPIQDILDQRDRYLHRANEQLLSDVATACVQMQGMSHYWKNPEVKHDPLEDKRNAYLCNALLNAQYSVAAQFEMGVGWGQKGFGKLDLLIYREGNLPWMICEAMNLTGSTSSQMQYWDNHLTKLLINYNPIGMKDLILLSYVDADADKFKIIWEAFDKHIPEYSPDGVTCQKNSYMQTRIHDYECLQTARCTYLKGGADLTVHHFFVRMGL